MLNFYCCFIDCNGYVQRTTIVEEKIKGCIIFGNHRKVRFNGWTLCTRYPQKRVNVTGIVIAVTEGAQYGRESSWLCTSFNGRTSA